MRQISYLKDSSFLDALAKEKLKTVYAKVVVLNKEELPIAQVEGKVSGGSISVQGNSAVRRTGSMSMVLSEKENNLLNIDNLISINKKIKIFIGIENDINANYDNIIWFPLGVFVITQPNISHATNGTTVSLNFKDKMCLLNGECGGGLPASITFHEYDQVIGYEEVDDIPEEVNDYTVYYCKGEYRQWDNQKGWITGNPKLVGTIVSRPQRMFDIIQTAVINYGGENPAKIFINDVPLEIKASVRYVGSNILYYNTATGLYTLNQQEVAGAESEVREFKYNEDIGYIYTDFTYPGELISGLGENVTSVLDKIKNALGNYEYFYDVDGNFIFQEIKNYLNTSYDMGKVIEDNSILNTENYKVGFNNVAKSVYTFEEGSALISSYSNAPSYLNMKNDFHIWGENDDGYAIHYHVAIKEKPAEMNEYHVNFITDEEGKYTGQVRLATAADLVATGVVTAEELKMSDGELGIALDALVVEDDFVLELETLYLTEGAVQLYVPEDWRAELYLQGLRKRELGQRPDVYEQELLDMFDSIYDFKNKCYKEDIVKNPNSLIYYIDFLDPVEKLHDCSVDAIGMRVYSYQQDKINKLYNTDVPDNILINVGFSPIVRARQIVRCEEEGQTYSNISQSIYDNIAIGVSGYTAHETARELLYQYTDYNESISIQSIPMYYLDTNMRISVYDKVSNIHGDYIINSISLPLDAKGVMSISATRALERL